MLQPPTPVRDLKDLLAVESRPLDSYCAVQSSYEALDAAAAQWPDKTALRFFIDGDCHDRRRIPIRARLRAAGALLRYCSPVARPYEEFSFREVREKVSQTARLFREYGVGRGDVVSLLLPNLPETLFCLWAAEAVGIVNPINPLLEPEIIESILVQANTRVLVTVGNLPGSPIWSNVQRLLGRVPSLRAVILVRGDGTPDCVHYRRALARQERAPLPREAWPDADDVASLFHTGGTTGSPKLVRGTHRNKLANAKMLALVTPLRREDVGLLVLPMFHVNAAINALFGLLLGMTTVIAGPAGFRTAGVRERFFDIIEQHRISYFSAVPTIFSALLQAPPRSQDLRSMRFAISAAAALPPAVMRAFEERTGIRIIEGYGQTEATVASCLTPFGAASRPGSVGLRLPFTRLKAAVLDGQRHVRDCAPDEIGQLLIAGDQVANGYLDPRHDRQLWVDDGTGMRWLATGDLARVDEHGYVWLTGRAKELIIRGGHNIDPRMIEEALQSHPDVVTAAAVGQPDARLGEVPVAYVTLAPGKPHHTDDLLHHATRHIPERAAWPKAIRVVDEMPLTAVGKVFKAKLVQLEHEQAVLQALQDLEPQRRLLGVECRPHPEHGLLTEVRLQASEGERRQVERAVAQRLGPFALRYRLTLEPAPARDALHCAGEMRATALDPI
jgi:fatty-acyl-CoA synthase